MDEQQRVLDSLQRVSASLLIRDAFLGHVLLRLVRLVTTEVRTAAVTIRAGVPHLLVNPDFWLRELRNEDERWAVLMHEVLHLLLGHLSRTPEFADRHRMNVAADLAVNSLIRRDVLPASALTVETPGLLRPDDQVRCQTMEWYYARITDSDASRAMQAVEGIRALRDALPVIVAEPRDAAARGAALYGSWLCGTVLGTVGMALHHKLCHTLGGSFDLPHAETHAVLIPHTAAFNAIAAAPALKPAADLFGGAIGPGLWDFAAALGAPMALRDLGLAEADLDRAADLAAQNPYWNPRPIARDGLRALLQDAWAGHRPQLGASA